MAERTQAPSERARVRRGHQRASYDRPVIHAILDASVLSHIAFIAGGAPKIIPTMHWREGERVYWHGSAASGMLDAADGQPIALCVSHLDGLVLARSAIKHTANYRSVVIHGRGERVTDPAKTLHHLERMIDHFFPGRWPQLRPIAPKELKATAVMSMPIAEASAKVRSGPPADYPEDLAHPVWAGQVDLRTVASPPLPDGATDPQTLPPPDIAPFWAGS